MHNVFSRNQRNWIRRKLNSRLVNRSSNPLFVYWKWITPQFLKGNKEMFAKSINPQVEATSTSLRLLAWSSHALMNAMAQFPEVSGVVEQTDNATRESAFSPVPTIRSPIYSSVSNGKCVQAGKGRSPWQQVQLLSLERKLETILDTFY